MILVALQATARPGRVGSGIEWLLQTVGLLGVPGLAALGVPQDRGDEIVARARTASG